MSLAKLRAPILKSKLAFYSIVASVFFLAIGTNFIQGGNYGRTEPSVIDFNTLVTRGPSGNAFLRLQNHCVLGEPIFVNEAGFKKLDSEVVFIPLFENVADAKSAAPIRVVLRVSRKVDQIEAIQAKLADPLTKIEGLCFHRLEKHTHVSAIANQYQRSAFGAHVIHHDSAPEMWMLVAGIAIILVVYAIYILSTFLMSWKNEKLKTLKSLYAMAFVGLFASILSAIIYCQNFDNFVFATIAIVVFGLGLSRFIVGVILIILSNKQLA